MNKDILKSKIKVNKKKLRIIIIIFMIVIFLRINTRLKSENPIIMKVALNNGDAKILDDYIITNSDSMLVLDLLGNIKCEFSDINANWLDGIKVDDYYYIVYGNFNNQIGLCKFNLNFELIENTVLFTSDNLMIDPTILETNNRYFLAITEIVGTINNADSNEENGIYTVKLYKSINLADWNYVSDIKKDNHNLEDTELEFMNDKLYLLYEQEQLDKGSSAICIIESDDEGETWGNEKYLTSKDSDNEPARLLHVAEGYILYYSSDKVNVGSSYNGASVYKSYYDSNFEIIRTEMPKLNHSTGVLLYDVKIEGDSEYYLFAENYLSDNILNMEQIKRK